MKGQKLCPVEVKWGVGLMEQEVRVAGGTAESGTGRLLIIKSCLCPSVFYTYKCLDINILHNSAAFYTFILY